MELSKNVLDGISLAGNKEVVNNAVYNLLLNEIFEVAAGNKSSKGIEEKCGSRSIKSAYFSILSFVLEAAKNDADSTSVSTVLEECRMDSDRISSFLNKFQENKERIQLQLSCIGSSFPHIVDVKWRQDYIVKSSNCERICEPSYIVSLKTWNAQTNTDDDVTFGCSLEQLQDLVLKLKDATKCIERNAA